MQLDKTERFVLRALREKFGVPTKSFEHQAQMKRVGVVYDFITYGDGTQQIRSEIIEGNNPMGGSLGTSELSKKDQYKERIGRMIAFSRAVLAFYEWKGNITGHDLESMIRNHGNGLDVIPLIVESKMELVWNDDQESETLTSEC